MSNSFELARHVTQVSNTALCSATFNAVAVGNETVSPALQAFVYFMIRHPDAWKRARAEMDAVGIGVNDRVVSYADAQRLPFLQVCMKEAIRVFAPAPMGLPRIAPEGGLTIGNRTIPEGTIVSVSVWVIHHSTEIWGPDARGFNPDTSFTEDAAHLGKYFIPVS